MRVDNAVIMAAGVSSRFAPLSFEKHKAMTEVKGEILIERQIRQLLDADVPEIIVVTGYKSEQFEWLQEKYGVRLIHNSDYLRRNNNGSIWTVRAFLGNTYICSSDNYFTANPFERDVEQIYYAAEYAEGHTEEWCMTEDEDGFINSASIGGENAWYMLGHAFWSRDFSLHFLRILEQEYDKEETKDKLWESIFIDHLDELKMTIRKYQPGVIYEFDTLDELRAFDSSYIDDSRSILLKKVSKMLEVPEKDICNVRAQKGKTAEAEGFEFYCPKGHFSYCYQTGVAEML